VAALLGAAALSVAPPVVSAASAATPTSCSFADAGTGTYARTLCWFDLSAVDPAQASTAAGQDMTVALPGGYTISFNLTLSGGPAAAVALPTYPRAYLGNTSFYTGITGKPALYQTSNATVTTATLSNITVLDSTNAAVAGYSFVGADAESTDAGESITWTSDANLSLLAPVGNACDNGTNITGVGTTSVTCAATVNSTKTGTAMLAAQHPTTLSQSMTGHGLEAVAFGVLVSKVQLTKSVASRVDASDAFDVDVTSPSASVLGSGNTGTGNSGSTGEVTVLTSVSGEQFTLSEAATSGSLSNYDESWACTRNGATDAALPSGAAGASAAVQLGIGDFVDCTITNTAKPTSLSLVKHAGTPVDVNGDGVPDIGDTILFTFTVTNTGQLPITAIAVTDAKVGAVTCPIATLNVGASELCTAASVYAITAADSAAGEVDNTATASGTIQGTSTTVTSGPSSTSTPVAGYSISKTASTATAKPGDVVTYTITVTNTGEVAYTRAAPASFVDDISNVLVRASYNNDATGGATFTNPSLSWSGALPVGATATVTYSVAVRGNASAGTMHNAVVVPAASGSDCQAGSTDAACFVDVTVDPPAVSGLALTGSTFSPLLIGGALLAILAGLALAMTRAMRNRREI
jgi:uncharacterized repeat protein (TIGR01451 family)